MKKKIFVDTDVILDLLAQREPYYPYAAELFTLIDSGEIKAYVSPIIFSNLHYILRKQTNKESALKSLLKLKLLVSILPVNEKIIELALASDFPDFEDAIQFYVAKENDIACLLTRNKKDFAKADITVMTPEELLNLAKSLNDTKSHFSS
jgi:predicted nucleic acid-binding protein